jgi:2,5-diketo-D-gluconate reductase A
MLADLVPTVTLNDGRLMPVMGLGTYPLDDREVRDAVVMAAAAGYRMFDTAERYGNEAGVGEGVRACGLPREELFVTTKLDGERQGNDRALAGIDASLARMKLDYVDLLLIHWPLPRREEYVSTWKTFEAIASSGKAKSIGVSNFKPGHLDRLEAETDVVPAVNQIELSPYTTRNSTRAYNSSHGILTQGWSPLAPGSGLLGDKFLATIAERHAKTPAQVVLRWFVQMSVVPMPKSGRKQRIEENVHIFDFELTAAEVAEITSLDHGEGTVHDSDRTGH